MEKTELIEELRKIAPQGRITCSEAHQLAEKFNINLSEIGKACDEAKIKISVCELGCF